MTSRHSFEIAIDHLKTMIEKDIIKDTARVIILGNKADKPQRQITYEEAFSYGTEIGSFEEVSANSDIATQQIYQTILATKTYSAFKNQMEAEKAKDLVAETAPLPISAVVSIAPVPFSIAAPPQIEYIKQSHEYSHILKLIVIGP